MKVPDSGKIINVALLLGMVVIMFVIYKILAGLGIIKTASSRRADKAKEESRAGLRTDEYFNPTYYIDKKFKMLGNNTATLYAQNLRKALRGLGTDNEAIYSVFGKLYNKTNISEVAAAYFLQYDNDLQADLSDDLTDKETVILMNIINELPLT